MYLFGFLCYNKDTQKRVRKVGVTMKDTWSLDALYTGYDDPQFDADIAKLKESVQAINALPDTLSHDDELNSVTRILQCEEAFVLLAGKLGSYLALRQSTDTTNAKTVAYFTQIRQIANDSAKAMARIDAFIQTIEDIDALCAQSAFLKEYEYLLKQTKQDGQYRLSEAVEEVIAKLDLSAGDAWSKLQEYLTSTLSVPYKDTILTLSEVRNLAYDSDCKVRKEAYEAELAAYDTIKQSVAFALNNIKSQVNTISDLRGFASPLDMTLYYSRMERATLDVMMEAIQEYLPVFHRYLKRKGELLGHKNGLPWYDLFAPLQLGDHDHQKYSLSDAKAYLLAHFTPFAKDLADMIERAFDEEWIDFFPRKGKVGGAFCYNLPYIKQSRVLTNYDGALGDIVTLAHELGHAYHGMMIEDHRALNTDYSMPVAESASTFNENIIMNAAIDEESDPQKKLVLIEKQLQDVTQIICDIYSRFLFESEVFEKRRNSFLFADECCEIMIKAQKKAYGDALDPDFLHPYMWVNKSHYYSSSLSFYNFPYAFGGLFARGLVNKYKQEGNAFVEQYRKMLKATTICHVEDAAAIVHINLKDKQFWRESLETCKQRVEEFIVLSNK